MEGYYTGYISNIDTERGFVKVTYPQENNIVSDWLPLLAFEYNPPEVGAYVATVLDKNLNGVCFGKIFSYAQSPEVTSGYQKNIDGVKVTKNKNTFQVDFGGGAVVKYSGGTLYVKADKIVLDGYTPTIKE